MSHPRSSLSRSTQDRVPGLGAHVQHDAGPARLERQWSVIARRASGPRATRKHTTWVAVVAVAIVIGFLGRRFVPQAPSCDAATFATTSSSSEVRREGASIVLAPVTRAVVDTCTDARATIALEQGRVTLDVDRTAGRQWVVAAGEYEVRVVGTKFSVLRDGDRVSVDVERGRVEVLDARDPSSGARTLSAGETWSAEPKSAAVGATAEPVAPAAGPSSSAAAQPPASAAAAPSGGPAASVARSSDPAPSAAAPPSLPEWEEHAKARRYKQAYESLGADGFARAVDGAGADRLMRLAEIARASGHLRDAARAFDAVRTRHRGDGRAGLAAFELGRLRLDALGSPGGAAEAFADAIALAPGAPFRQDAEARRVHALHASGNVAACIQARDAYLARYPSGAHAAVVQSRCGGGGK